VRARIALKYLLQQVASEEGVSRQLAQCVLGEKQEIMGDACYLRNAMPRNFVGNIYTLR
jgi:hypothetical protein